MNLTINSSQGEPARQCPSVLALSPGLGKGPKLQPDMIGQDAPETGCQFGLSTEEIIEAQASQLLCAIYTCTDGETEAPERARDNPYSPYLLHK